MPSRKLARTGIEQVELGRLDDPLAEALEVGWHEGDLSRDLEDAEPLRDRRHRDAERRGQIRLVQDLPGARRQQPQQPPERAEVANRADGSDVALQVCLHVGREPEPRRRCSRSRHDLGEPAAEQGDPRRLLGRQGQELQHRGPAGKGLGDAAHERRLLRARQYPTAHAPRLGVDQRADVAQKLRGVLDLVEDRGLPRGLEKAPRVGSDPTDEVGILEQVIRRAGKRAAQQRRLAGAPRPGENQRRKAAGRGQ